MLIPGKVESYSLDSDVSSAMARTGSLNPPRPLATGVALDKTGCKFPSSVVITSVTSMVHLVSLRSAVNLSPSYPSTAEPRPLPSHGLHNGVTAAVSIETTLAEACIIGPLPVHSSVIVMPGGPILVVRIHSTYASDNKVVLGTRSSGVVAPGPTVMPASPKGN